MGEWGWFLPPVPLCMPRSAPSHHISAVLRLLHSLCCSLFCVLLCDLSLLPLECPLFFVLCLLLPLFVEKARTLSLRKGVCSSCVCRGAILWFFVGVGVFFLGPL